MLSIFFDLETTDTNPIGQIINFSFITVDKNWKIVSEFSEDVKISRLQLPSPGAILANRTDVLRHQKNTTLTEREAMRQIYDYIEGVIRAAGDKVRIIGYNSTRFDIPFLRTSLIRNGLPPYFRGKLIYKDLLLAARKLSCSDSSFPRVHAKGGEKEKLSLTLETLTRTLGVLKGKQTHQSRDDVILTIDFAKYLASEFKLDVRSYDPFETASLHSQESKGEIYHLLNPNYDLKDKNLAVKTPMTLLDFDYRYALWINLDRYREGEGRKSIKWFNKSAAAFFCDNKVSQDSKLLEVAHAALKEFSNVKLRNFFPKSTCDIEQDIYRLDFDLIDALHEQIWQGRGEKLSLAKSQDAKSIQIRNQLANYEWGSPSDQKVEKMLARYALYRYGGKAKISKFDDEGESARVHPTFKELYADLSSRLKDASAADRKLLESLKAFYLESDIFRLVGPEIAPSELIRAA